MSSSKAEDSSMSESLEMDEDCDEFTTDSPHDNWSDPDSPPESSASTYVSPFTYYNGRRYHSDRFYSGSYFMPNDEVEQERLDLYHHVFTLMNDGKLTTVPFEGKGPQMVLDVGTGTGIWAIDFAGEYPEATIIGTDLSPIQPLWVPPNVTFEVNDIEEPWSYLFKRSSFDLVHIRTLSGSIKDWDALLLEALEYTKPGGYVEFQDYGCELRYCDGEVPKGTKLAEYMQLCCDASEKAGRPLNISSTIKDRMIRLGFEDVTQKKQVWPAGPWPKDKYLKDLGRFGQLCLSESLEAFCLELLTKHGGWTVADVKTYCASVKEDTRRSRGLYFEVFFVYGRRPLNPSTNNVISKTSQ